MTTKFKQVNKVLQTKNYSMFKFRNDNRDVNEPHVRKLTKNMKENGWMKGSIVVVNEKNEIIDGQHRIKAAITAGVPVEYIVSRGSGIREIIGNNVLTNQWNIKTYLDHHVKQGNTNYQVLKDFMVKYPMFKFTELTMFLNNGLNNASRGVFESGDWKIKNVKTAELWVERILQLKPYFEQYNRSIFVRAVVKIMSKKTEFSFDEFLHKVKLRPTMLRPCGTVDQYVEMIEELYNYHRRNDEKLNLRF
jgi:hypothetical protein